MKDALEVQEGTSTSGASEDQPSSDQMPLASQANEDIQEQEDMEGNVMDCEVLVTEKHETRAEEEPPVLGQVSFVSCSLFFSFCLRFM